MVRGTVAEVERYPVTRIGRKELRLKTMHWFTERVPFNGKTVGIIEEKDHTFSH